MSYRYEDRGITLRLFESAELAMKHPDTDSAVRFQGGWLGRTLHGSYMDCDGEVPTERFPSGMFEIRSGNFAEIREPTVGKWYCAVEIVEDLDSTSGWGNSPGVLAEYVGDGEFYDGDSDETQNMRYSDYLVEQA